MSSDFQRGEYGRPPHRSGDRRGGGRKGIPLSELPADLTESSRRLIGAAIEVHKGIGPGYDAATYLTALKAELGAQSIAFKSPHSTPVMYRDTQVGSVTCDLFIEQKFFVQVTSRAGEVSTADRLALRAHLKAANLDLGLIINFSERRLKDGLVRVLNVEKINADRGVSFEDSDHDGGSDGAMHDFDH